jgi:AcrR family transcriptional regulator
MARLSAAQRRDDFIRAAVQVVVTHGVDGATTRRIAEEAKANLATLHYCFPSKEALLFAVYEYQLQGMWDLFKPPREHAGLGRTAGNLLRAMMEWYQTNETTAQAQMELYFWVVRENEELGRKAYELFDPRIEQHLRAGMRPGDDELLVPSLARVVIAITDGLVMRWVGFRNWDALAFDIDVAAESVERLAEHHRLQTPLRESG